MNAKQDKSEPLPASDLLGALVWLRYEETQPTDRDTGRLFLVLIDWPAFGASAMGRYLEIARWSGIGWMELDEDRTGWVGPVKAVTHWTDIAPNHELRR